MMRYNVSAAFRWCSKPLLWVCTSFVTTAICFSQAPPNDNFVDRIKLEGHSISFTGNVAQATYQEWEEFEQGVCWRGTIWWSWTALESTPVILQAFEHQRDYWQRDVLAVYAPTNLDGFPTNAHSPAVVKMRLDPEFPGEWVSFSANAGMDYQIRLMGCGSYKFRLVATNNPVIFEEPKGLTVAPNAGAFFNVMAAGIQPLSYQWQFNGTPLVNETNAMLALNNVTWDDAGLYSVIVSNSTGAAISQPAHLQIRDAIVAPVLSVSQVVNNQFCFAFSGETGRSYRIEYSTNLINWSAASNFPLITSFRTSVIFNNTNNLALSLPHTSGSKFVRALSYSPSNHVCDNNLKAIRIAKELWANAVDRGLSDTPRGSDILPYLKNNKLPSCPVGGSNSYVMTALDRVPTCQIAEHLLEEPR